MSLIGVRKIPLLSKLSEVSTLSLFEQVQALFQSGAIDGFLFPVRPEYCFEERASQTTQSSVGGVVGSRVDQSGNGYIAVAPSDAARPILRQSGSYYYLEYDGVNDCFQVSFSAISQIDTVFQAVKIDVVKTQYLFDSVNGSIRQAMWTAGGSIVVFAGSSGTTSVSPGTADFVHQTEYNGASTVFRYDGTEETVNAGNSSIAGMTIGIRNDLINAPFAGREYCTGLIDKQLSSDEKQLVDQYLASLNGVSL